MHFHLGTAGLAASLTEAFVFAIGYTTPSEPNNKWLRAQSVVDFVEKRLHFQKSKFNEFNAVEVCHHGF